MGQRKSGEQLLTVTVRLYMDHDSLDARVVSALRSQGCDVLTSLEAGNQRLPDDEQLSFAAQQQRAIYSANCGDFLRIHGQWMREGRSHAGILLRAQQRMQVGDQVRALLSIGHGYDTLGLRDLVLFVDAFA